MLDDVSGEREEGVDEGLHIQVFGELTVVIDLLFDFDLVEFPLVPDPSNGKLLLFELIMIFGTVQLESVILAV